MLLWSRYAFHLHWPQQRETALEWLGHARETYLRIKKCYLDQGAYDAAAWMAYREKEMEREICDFKLLLSVCDMYTGLKSNAWRAARWVRRVTQPLRAYLPWTHRYVEVADDAGRGEVYPEEYKRPKFEEDLERVRNADTAWEERTKPKHTVPFWNSSGAWWYHRWKLNGFIFFRAVVGYGEYPFRAVKASLAVIAFFAIVFFLFGAPTTVGYDNGHSALLEEIAGGQPQPSAADQEGSLKLLVVAAEEELYGLPWLCGESSPVSPEQAWRCFFNGTMYEQCRKPHAIDCLWQPPLLSLECFSTLGFFWLSQRKFTFQNYIAGAECLLGLYFTALFIWAVGRRLAAR